MKKLLALHVTGCMQDDVCVHDPKETHVTVSSCVIEAHADWTFSVDAVNTPPCRAALWDSWTIGPSAKT